MVNGIENHKFSITLLLCQNYCIWELEIVQSLDLFWAQHVVLLATKVIVIFSRKLCRAGMGAAFCWLVA